MAVDCTPDALAEVSRCFNAGYDRFMLQAMRIVAWCNFLNGDTMECSPESMAEAANCLIASLSAGQLDAAETYLACQIANGGGGGGGTTQVYENRAPAAPDDPTKPAVSFPTGGGMLSQWPANGPAWV